MEIKEVINKLKEEIKLMESNLMLDDVTEDQFNIFLNNKIIEFEYEAKDLLREELI